jgi:hypothetical protein
VGASVRAVVSKSAVASVRARNRAGVSATLKAVVIMSASAIANASVLTVDGGLL